MEKHEKLNRYVQQHKDSEFIWGTNDCCTFASDWVAEVSGINPLEDLGHYGKYTTAKEAKKLLKKLGGVKKIVDKVMGSKIPVSFAGSGDLVCGELGHGDTLGICIGTDSVFLGEESLVIKRTLTMKQAWRV